MHQIEFTRENMNHNVFADDEANLSNFLCVTFNSKTQLQTKWATQACYFFAMLEVSPGGFWQFNVK